MKISKDLNLDPDQSYQTRQHSRYRGFLALGQTSAAQDALWRAASAADLLHPDETGTDALSDARTAELIAKLGWES
jgi:hypothetical protein